MEIVRELMKKGVEYELAVRACRATLNIRNRAIQLIQDW